MLLRTDYGLCDGGLLVVGRHGNEGQDGASLLAWHLPGNAGCRIPNQKGYSALATIVSDFLSNRAGGGTGGRLSYHGGHS